jgi:hypothetical protein
LRASGPGESSITIAYVPDEFKSELTNDDINSILELTQDPKTGRITQITSDSGSGPTVEGGVIYDSYGNMIGCYDPGFTDFKYHNDWLNRHAHVKQDVSESLGSSGFLGPNGLAFNHGAGHTRYTQEPEEDSWTQGWYMRGPPPSPSRPPAPARTPTRPNASRLSARSTTTDFIKPASRAHLY